jgi:DNA-binding MurR/RpiR family transcriptional regulator
MVARLARERCRPVIALTSNLRSHLAGLASHVLTVAAEEPNALVALRLGDSALGSIVASGAAMSRMNDLPDRYRRSSGGDP